MSVTSLFRKAAASMHCSVHVMFYFMFCAASLGVITWLTCPKADDINYSIFNAPYIYRGEPFVSPRAFWDVMVNHYLTMNGRLGDKFIYLYVSLPSWVRGIICFATWLYIFTVSCRLIQRGKIVHGWMPVMFASLCVLALPWYESGFLACMYLNYNLPIAVILAWAWYYMHPPRLTPSRVCGVVLLSFCAGSWHEGFSLIALPALLICQFVRGDKKAMSWVSIAAFALGVVFILAAPGFWMRMDNEYSQTHFVTGMFLMKGSYSLLFLVVLVTLVFLRFVMKREFPFDRRDWLFLFVLGELICGTSYVDFHIQENNLRLWWFALFAALMGWTLLLSRLVRWRRLLCGLSMVLASVTVVNLAAAIYSQYFVWRDYRRIMTSFIASPDGRVFDRCSSPRLPFWLTLFKAQNNQFVHFELDGYARVHPYGRSLRLLSPELLDMQGVTLDTVKGEGETFYRTPDGTLLCRRTVKSDMTYVLLIYRDDHGELRSALTICSPIIAPSDSAMCQLTPHVSIFQSPASICSPLYLDILQ